MEVLDPTALLAEPNKCIICDETPHPAEQRVVDTGQTMVAPFSDNVWHKYVCEKCGLDIANRLGFVSNKQAKTAYHAAEAATSRLTAVRDTITNMAAEIQAFAFDIELGNERSTVAKTVEGDFVEGSDTVQPDKAEVKSKPSRARKATPVGATPDSGA